MSTWSSIAINQKEVEGFNVCRRHSLKKSLRCKSLGTHQYIFKATPTKHFENTHVRSNVFLSALIIFFNCTKKLGVKQHRVGQIEPHLMNQAWPGSVGSGWEPAWSLLHVGRLVNVCHKLYVHIYKTIIISMFSFLFQSRCDDASSWRRIRQWEQCHLDSDVSIWIWLWRNAIAKGLE